MTNLNPLFDAMNNIDDSVITNAEKSNKKPIFLRVGIIAAAAAMLALGVGFTAKITGVFGTGKDTFTLGNDLTIQFNIQYHEITIPEEFEVRYDYFDSYRPENMKPSEMFTKFGVSPLLNDNFFESCNNLEVIMNIPTSIEFSYMVQDKKLGTEVYIHATYYILENMSVDGFTEDKDLYPEVVTLNDGSSCIVTSNMATFAYDGVYYHISIYGEEKSHDITKQILTDLGVL